MNDQRIELMKNAPISKAINHMAIPATIGLMVMAIYNFVDTMFVAWLGTEATGATQVVMPVMMLFSAFGLAFGMGGGSYVSRLLGMDKKDYANEVGTVTLLTAGGVGILVSALISVFLKPVLSVFGATDSIMTMSLAYGRYIVLGGAFQVCNMTLNNLLRSEGSAKLSMIGMGAGALLNIALDPLFIFVFGLGIRGAAMATALSQVVTFIILISRYLNHHSVLKLSLKYFRPSVVMYGNIFKVGIPTFFRQLLFSISLAFMNQAAVAMGGDYLLAASGLIFKIVMIPNYVIFGFGQGFQPVAGYNYGAGHYRRVIDALVYTLKVCIVIATVSAAGLLLFEQQIISIFRPVPIVADYCIRGFSFYAPSIILMSVSNTIAVLYQALGKGRESLLLSVARQGIYFIPALFILPALLGVDGVLSAQLVADGLAVLTTAALIIPYIQSGRLEEEMHVQMVQAASLRGETS